MAYFTLAASEEELHVLSIKLREGSGNISLGGGK